MSSCMRLGSGLRTRSASLTVSRGVSSPRGRELSEVGCGRSYMRCKPHPCLLTCDVSAYSARAACARGHEARVAVVMRQRHTVHRLQVCSSRLACDSTVQLEDCGDVGLHQSTTSNRARAAGAWVYFLARVRAVATRQQRAAPRLGRMRACHMHRLHPVRGHTVRGCRRIGANRTVQRPRACGYVSWRAYKLLLCVNTVHLSDCRRMRACQC